VSIESYISFLFSEHFTEGGPSTCWVLVEQLQLTDLFRINCRKSWSVNQKI